MIIHNPRCLPPKRANASLPLSGSLRLLLVARLNHFNRRTHDGIASALMALLLGFWPTSAWLAESDSDRLDNLRTDIKTAQKNQSKNKQQQQQIRQQVVELETDIDRLSQTVSKLHRQKHRQEQQIDQLNIALTEQKERLSEHQQLLAHLARRAYLNGQQEYLKLLINQQDPADIQRMLSYYRYLQLAHVSEIDALEAAIATLLQTQQQLTELTDAANQTLEQIGHRQDALAERRGEHSRLLALLVDDYQDNQTKLNRMVKDEARLADLVTQLQQHIKDIPDRVIQRFANTRNQLSWPVKGAIKHRFGQRKKGTTQRWNGVFLSTHGGSEVRAVHGGKVVFADWLRGFGLLIIVDHGEEYMSIYGQNQLLVPETGSWIEKGELIAHAGATGGDNGSGLYFEIRHRGKPIDPAKWCHQ